MLLSSIYGWARKSIVSTNRGARRSKQRRSPTFRPCLEQLEPRRLLAVVLQLGSATPINSYAGVGFQENEVATLAASDNGEPDSTISNFQATIQWGDGQSSAGGLVYTGSNGAYADFIIKGSHIYAQANSNIPITVTVVSGGNSISMQTTYGVVANMPSGIPGTPPSSGTNGAALANVVLQLGSATPINSYAGVGFQENEVATLAASVNGEADSTLSDFQAQINWGDSASWTAGDLVYTGTNGGYGDYIIKGSHVYAQATSNIPIVVYATGPDGTSTTAQTTYGVVANMSSGIPGTQPPAGGNGMAPANVVVQLGSATPINSNTGIGFNENEVATLAASVNGQADTTLSDFQAQINWGDSASWTAGDLVYSGTNGGYADYIIKGSHVYAKASSDIPIVVYATGPDGTSTSAKPPTPS